MESPSSSKPRPLAEPSAAMPVGKSKKKRKVPAASSDVEAPSDSPPVPHTHARKQRHCEVEQRRRNRLKGHYEQLDWLCVQIDPTLGSIRRDRDATLMSAIRIIRTLLDTRSAAPAAFNAFNALYTTGLPVAHTHAPSPSDSSLAGPAETKPVLDSAASPSSLGAPLPLLIPPPPSPAPSPASKPAPPAKRAAKTLETDSKSAVRAEANKKKKTKAKSPAPPAKQRKSIKSVKSEKASTNSARSESLSIASTSEGRRSAPRKEPAASDSSTTVSLVTDLSSTGSALPASSPSAVASPQSANTNEPAVRSTATPLNSLPNVPRSVSSGDPAAELPPFAAPSKGDLASRLPGPSASMADLFFAMSNTPRGAFTPSLQYSMPEMTNSTQTAVNAVDPFRAMSPPFLSQMLPNQHLASKDGVNPNVPGNPLLGLSRHPQSPSPFHMLANPNAYFNPMAASSIGFSSNVTTFPLAGSPHLGQFSSHLHPHPYGSLLASAQGSQLAGPSLSALSPADLRALAALTQQSPTPQQLAAMAVAAAQAATKAQ